MIPKARKCPRRSQRRMAIGLFTSHQGGQPEFCSYLFLALCLVERLIFFFQISDVLSVFSLVAQSLRTGEPMHVVLPQSLLDRLLYHDIVVQATTQTGGIDHLQELRSLNYLFYATAVIGVLQIIEVRAVLAEEKRMIYHVD